MPQSDDRDYNAPGDPRFERIIHGFTAENNRRQNSTRAVTATFSLRKFPLIVAAARARDISLAGFVSRAALAMAVRDLGLDWDDEMKQEKAPSRHGQMLDRPDEWKGGQGAGPWKITSVE